MFAIYTHNSSDCIHKKLQLVFKKSVEHSELNTSNYLLHNRAFNTGTKRHKVLFGLSQLIEALAPPLTELTS